VTTADASIATGDLYYITQIIEGYNYAPFEGNTGTLSFWVKGTKTGIHCVSFRSSTQDRSYVAEYTINTTNTWEKKTISVTFDYSGGTWDYVNGAGLQVSWALAAGATYQGIADTWNSATDLATSNQVNAMDNAANDFRIAQVQFELGSSATDFEYRDYATELAMCQRYYEKSNNRSICRGDVTNAATYNTNVVFKVEKRVAPTMVYTSVAQSGFASGAPASNDIGTSLVEVYNTANATLAGGFYIFSWTASAEL